MKKFKFTMQSLYNVKIALEKQHKAELEEADSRLVMFEAQLFGMERQVESQRADFSEKVKAGINSAQAAVYGTGFRVMQERIEKQKERIQVAESEKLRIQKKLLEVMRERKMLETLRDKQREEYLAECRLEESKEIEDFVSNKLHAERIS